MALSARASVDDQQKQIEAQRLEMWQAVNTVRTSIQSTMNATSTIAMQELDAFAPFHGQRGQQPFATVSFSSWVLPGRKRARSVDTVLPREAEEQIARKKVPGNFPLVLATIEHHKIVQVFNADQTAMNYEFLPSTMINEIGSKAVWVRNSGAEKKCLTVMLLADSRGHKLTLFVILKQAPSKVPDTQAFNQQQQNGFGRGVWREVAPLIC
ncbi:hypothetical protein BBJ28_00020306 [Nothophytophthora sp. Chile5]|nr:hypothetical protein BBJ28_00020306 [Nothophytophthora sp. Chile5]